MKKIIKFFSKRIVIVGLMLLFQIGLIIFFAVAFSGYSKWFYAICQVLGLVSALFIVNDSNRPPEYRIVWLMLVLIFPIFGTLMFLLYGADRTTIRSQRKTKLFRERSRHYCEQNRAIEAKLLDDDKNAYRISKYITDSASYPIYENTEVTYFEIGEKKIERLKWELSGARRFIFMEYFIIEEGTVWEEILDILKRKASEGVEVRVMYDDFGCIDKLPYKYFQTLEKYGIHAVAFNPFIPIMTSRLNNRDHRKICVIDGVIGFTGGINLADEYANRIYRFGHWKDTAVMLHGEAVWSLTVMFLTMWEYAVGKSEDYEKYKANEFELAENIRTDGLIQPYTNCPYHNEALCEAVYLGVISKATDYLYITTPYLIIDSAIETALKNAAKSGVDVRIITPHIPDKKTIFEATRASYVSLLKAGVKIYEYTPGFIHAKIFVADDRFATVGTANLDYRSLYLHFECGVFLYKSGAIPDIKADFVNTLKICKRQTLAEMKRRSPIKKLIAFIVRIFAPAL